MCDLNIAEVIKFIPFLKKTDLFKKEILLHAISMTLLKQNG